jgi:hypothetical protein
VRRERLSEKQIAGRVSYHDSQADYFERVGLSSMAAWSRKEAGDWRRKLEEFQRGIGQGIAGD